jgi:hypothetical protein
MTQPHRLPLHRQGEAVGFRDALNRAQRLKAIGFGPSVASKGKGGKQWSGTAWISPQDEGFAQVGRLNWQKLVGAGLF